MCALELGVTTSRHMQKVVGDSLQLSDCLCSVFVLLRICMTCDWKPGCWADIGSLNL